MKNRILILIYFIVILLGLSCNMRENSIPFEQVFIFPDTLSILDINLSKSDLMRKNTYDPHNKCLEYTSKDYSVYHFIESNNTYIQKHVIPEVLISEQGIEMKKWSKIIGLMSKNNDLENANDVEYFLQYFYDYMKLIRIDTSYSCLFPFFHIEIQPNESKIVYREELVIDNCIEYQEKLLAIHNEFKNRILGIFLFGGYELPDKFESLDETHIFYLLGQEYSMEIVHLNFHRTCFGMYHYQPIKTFR